MCVCVCVKGEGRKGISLAGYEHDILRIRGVTKGLSREQNEYIKWGWWLIM